VSVSAVELPTLPAAGYRRLARRARTLSWLSLAWMTVEGGVAIAAGSVASSVALVGFGLDSAIEGFASAIIVWRFTGRRTFSARAETRAQKLVAIQFFLLAPYVGVESVRALLVGERPGHSWVGVGLAVSSVILMPLLGLAKQRLADQLGSPATKGEGRQNMLCAYLAGALLLGLLGNALAGAWWLDPGVGLLIAAVAVKEGREAWEGEGCCVAAPEPFALPMIADCRLDADGLRSQRDRYRALGGHVAGSLRRPQTLTVRFDDGVDVDLLLETVDVERGCCSFFELAPDVERRELVVSVAGREQAPALDAIAAALGVSGPG
jgi:hypothetical protein